MTFRRGVAYFNLKKHTHPKHTRTPARTQNPHTPTPKKNKKKPKKTSPPSFFKNPTTSKKTKKLFAQKNTRPHFFWNLFAAKSVKRCVELFLSILSIFAATIITLVIERHKKDACLKDLNKRFVLVKLRHSVWIWGILDVVNHDIEILYKTPKPFAPNSEKTSYILYAANFGAIEYIIAPQPLSKSKARAFRRKTWFHKRILRKIRIIYTLLKSAFDQVFNLLITRFRPQDAPRQPIRSAENVSQTLLAQIPRSYEPILERKIFKHCIVETIYDDKKTELEGRLLNYTDKFLLLRHDLPPQDEKFPILIKNASCDILYPRVDSFIRHSVNYGKKTKNNNKNR